MTVNLRLFQILFLFSLKRSFVLMSSSSDGSSSRAPPPGPPCYLSQCVELRDHLVLFFFFKSSEDSVLLLFSVLHVLNTQHSRSRAARRLTLKSGLRLRRSLKVARVQPSHSAVVCCSGELQHLLLLLLLSRL